MYSATKSYQKQLLIWLLWAITIFVSVTPVDYRSESEVAVPALPGVLQHDSPGLTWRYRLRLVWRRQKRRLHRVYRHAVWSMHCAVP